MPRLWLLHRGKAMHGPCPRSSRTSQRTCHRCHTGVVPQAVDQCAGSAGDRGGIEISHNVKNGPRGQLLKQAVRPRTDAIRLISDISADFIGPTFKPLKSLINCTTAESPQVYKTKSDKIPSTAIPRRHGTAGTRHAARPPLGSYCEGYHAPPRPLDPSKNPHTTRPKAFDKADPQRRGP